MKDVIHHTTHHKFKFWDRIKILFGRELMVIATLESELPDVKLTGNNTCTTNVTPFIVTKSKGEGCNCADLKHELEVTDKLLNERQRVLDAIPECQSHGKCVPHAIEWIEEMKAKHHLELFNNY